MQERKGIGDLMGLNLELWNSGTEWTDTDSFEAGPGIRSRFHHEPFRAHDGLPDLTLSAFIRVDLRNPWSIPTASFREANARRIL